MAKLNDLLYDIRRIAEHREQLSNKRIEAIYNNLTKNLTNFLSEQYIKYADKDGRMYVATLDEARKKAWFLNEVQKVIDKEQPALRKEVSSLIDDVYTKSYKGISEAVKKADTTAEIAKVTKDIKVNSERLKQAVNNNVSKLTSLGVLEKNRAEIIYQIQQELNIGLMNGDRFETMAKRIAERTGVSKGRAMNIVRTETHRNTENGMLEGALEASKDFEDVGLIYAVTWRTRKDERVRPQQRRKTKKGWKTTMRGTANHMVMEGKTVKVGDKFDLGDGATATNPGNSGEAAHDCNCRCFLEYNIMTVEEFEKATGKKVVASDKYGNKIQNKFIDLGLDNDTAKEIGDVVDNIPKGRKKWANAFENTKYDIVDDDTIVPHFDPDSKVVTMHKRDKANTALHETAHAMDRGAVEYVVDKGRSWEYTIDSASALVQHKVERTIMSDIETFAKAIGAEFDDDNGIADNADTFMKYFKWADSKTDELGEVGFDSVSDILSGLTDDKIQASFAFGGHSKEYWGRAVSGGDAFMQYQEAWADYCTLRATDNQVMLELLDEVAPNLSKALQEVYDEVF